MECDELNVDDVYVAIMGKTGAGKSTFAVRCTEKGQELIGQGLESFTKRTIIHSMQHRGQTVHLIDTPGFSDTYRSDEDVFLEIAYALIKAYELGIRINGIVFIQPMLETRVQGSTRQFMDMLRGLCGKAAYPCVFLAANHCHEVPPQKLRDKLYELKSEAAFWKELCDGGSTVLELDDRRDSALAVLDAAIDANKKFVLQFQRQVIDEGMRIHETAAGKVIFSGISGVVESLKAELSELKEELRDARQQSQKKEAEELQHSVQEAQDAIADERAKLVELDTAAEDLKREWDAKYFESQLQLTDKLEELDGSIKQLNADLQMRPGSRHEPPPAYDAVVGQLDTLRQERKALARYEQMQLSRKSLRVAKGAQTAGWLGALAGIGSLGLAAAPFAVLACTVM